MKNMRLGSMNIDFIEKVEGSKLSETLAMTAFAPTGGGQSKRRAGLRPIGCLKPSNINTFKNLIVMQLGVLSCGNSGRASPKEDGGIFDCTPPNLPLWGGTLLCHPELVSGSLLTDIGVKRLRNKCAITNKK